VNISGETLGRRGLGILFMGAARRAAQGDCKSPLSAPLANLAISKGLMRSLCSQAMYDCRAVYKQRWEEKDFQKETRTRANVPIQGPTVFAKD
jgi:hypothetical protein